MEGRLGAEGSSTPSLTLSRRAGTADWAAGASRPLLPDGKPSRTMSADVLTNLELFFLAEAFLLLPALMFEKRPPVVQIQRSKVKGEVYLYGKGR